MALRMKPSIKLDGRVILNRFIPEINLTNNQVAENASVGTVVGSAQVLNSGSSEFTFELIDEGSTGDFSMTTGGVISVASALNHEEQSVYPVQIKSVDSRGNKYAIATNLIVGDINEPPINISITNNEVILDIDNSGKSVAIASAVDPDAGEIITWTLTSNPFNQFAIDANTGEITLQNPIRNNSHTIEIQAEDSGNLTYSEQFVITLSAKEQKIQAPTPQADAWFGERVDVARTNQVIAIGSPFEDNTFSNEGGVYVFEEVGGSWVFQDKILTADISAADVFGSDISITEDGNKFIAGARSKRFNGTFNVGAAYVFTRSSAGASWNEQQKLVAADASAQSRFGNRVAISKDGSTIVVGANLDNENGTDSGAAYIFTESGGVWSQQQKIVSSDVSASDNFGIDVAISKDGSTIAVGAYEKNNEGAVYIFTESGGVWSQQQKLIGSDTGAVDQGDSFGGEIDISDDGNIIVISALRNSGAVLDGGGAYVFTRSGSTWTQEQKLVSSDMETGDRFGGSVSITGDGTQIVVGAWGENTGGGASGAAYIFKKNGSSWGETIKLQISTDNFEPGEVYGLDSCFGNNNTLSISARLDNGTLSNTGGVFIYDFS